MPQVIQSPEFRQDTDEAWDYFAEDDQDYAERFIRQIADRLMLLARFPHMGRSREELRPGLRSFGVGRYVIYYRVLGEEHMEAVRLLHSARDIEGLF